MLASGSTHNNVGYNGRSLIDYIIIGPSDMLSQIKYFDVKSPNILSDHCDIQFALQSSNVNMDGDYDNEHSYT